MRCCLDCGTDISHRHGNAKWCETCAPIARKRLDRERQNRKRANPEFRAEFNRRRRGETPDQAARRRRQRRERYRTDPAYRARVRTANNEWEERSGYGERRLSRHHERFQTDPAYRARRRTEGRRRGPAGYRKHLPELIEAQGGLCGICGEPLPSEISAETHVDHIIPRAKDGGDEIENLQATHATCNRKKAAA